VQDAKHKHNTATPDYNQIVAALTLGWRERLIAQNGFCRQKLFGFYFRWVNYSSESSSTALSRRGFEMITRLFLFTRRKVYPLPRGEAEDAEVAEDADLKGR